MQFRMRPASLPHHCYSFIKISISLYAVGALLLCNIDCFAVQRSSLHRCQRMEIAMTVDTFSYHPEPTVLTRVWDSVLRFVEAVYEGRAMERRYFTLAHM